MQRIMEPNWSNLPRDILERISLKIISVVDYVRFRAVCVAFRSVLPGVPHNLVRLPWLMLPHNPNKNEGNDDSARFDSTLFFYDLANSKIHSIHLPETRGKELFSSSRGWLTLQNGPEISLLNPITRAQIHLPSLKPSPNLAFKPLLPSYIRCKLGIWPFWYNYKERTDPIIQKTKLLSTDPNPKFENNCVVMALLKNNWGLAFCKIGDESWTLLDEPQIHEDYIVIDATYHNKSYYTISRKEVKIYNLDGSRKEVIKIDLPLDLAEFHVIDGTLDELLLVAEQKRGEFSIYKLNKEGDPSWIEVKNFGEITIFLCSANHQCFSFQMDNWKLESFGENMLCSAYPFVQKRHKNIVEFEYKIDLINLPSRDVTRVATSLGSFNTSCKQALWFTPILY